MNVLSLFAGIGGLDLGLERAGMTVIGQVEIDPFCQKILARHWPDVPRHDDVRTAVEWWQSETRPPVDLICGGFPCQPVSVAGRKLAQDDPRWLWPTMANVLRCLRPPYVLVENVPNLRSRGMGDVLGDLAACGYDAEWDCVPAAAVGARHRRDRIWIVAYPNGSAEPSVGDALICDGEASVLPGGATKPRGRGCDVADPTGNGRGACGKGRPAGIDPDREGFAPQELAIWPGRRTEPIDCGWWATEPGMDRVAHGISARVERSRALGNAVVPQVAEYVGRLIMAAEGPPVDHALHQIATIRGPATCPVCNRAFDPTRSHAGTRNVAERKYCSVRCRREQYRRKRAHRRRYAELIALHAAEDAGQLSLDPTPLPPVPELPTNERKP